MKYYAPALCGVIFAVFLLQQIPGFTEAFLLSGFDRPWTLVTSVFLHGDPMHLLSNLFALGLFGLIFESRFGEKRLLAVFFAGGIASSIASAFFYDASLGASGAIFAVIGVVAVTMPRMIVWNLGVPMPMIVAAIVWLLLDVAGVFFPSSTANMAHIAGMIFGAVVGLAWRKPENRKDSRAVDEKEIDEWEERWME
ncbi:MAG: rhomboid family intramembrane serine protease [Candidatus Aenigmarchaeota archaeon]|nr:rhomboid family intramembrane serine protease [Candidatus Aenigmarchaeota archaeon]